MISSNVIECGKGWAKLYEPIIQKILEYDSTKENESEKIGIYKVYENYGALALKVYHERNIPKDIMDMAQKAYIKSLNTCSFCGANEELGATINEPYFTCCKKCWEENVLPKYPKSILKMFKTNKFYKNSEYGK